VNAVADSLEGRVVAVAGAAGNLGPTVVARLLAEGARVCACGRDQESLSALAASVGAIDTDVIDLLDPDATRAWAGDLAQRHGRVDGLVHLVGGWRGGTPIEDAPLDDWDDLSALLVRTVQHATQAFALRLIDAGGRFVLVSTGQAQAPTRRRRPRRPGLSPSPIASAEPGQRRISWSSARSSRQ
jgi:NAD(P)-dependent dehydrogenase (short-subunit alcohol dehydrogenase family)